MPHLHSNGIAVHFRRGGSGPPVVLLHGGGSSGAQWKRVGDLLGDRYTVVTMDHYGHGGTEPWPGVPEARSHEAEAELVRAVMAHLDEPVHLVGHSYGGGVALRLAVQSPLLLRSLALLEPIALSVLTHRGEGELAQGYREFALAFLRDVEAGDPAGAWERFLDGNAGAGSWARTKPEARERFLAMTDAVASAWHANLNHATTPEECRALRLPTLMLCGECTPRHFRRITELLAELLPAARLEVLPGAGHMSPLTHPEPVAAALAAHLEQQEAAEAG
jgi:pimeloyl-ACP methyl ester carboxylesterase